MESEKKEKTIMKLKFTLAVGLIFTLILGACWASSGRTEISPTSTIVEPSPSPAPPTPTSQSPESIPDEPQVDLPPGAVIVYRQSGGFAGLNEEWTIYADGRVTAKDGSQWQASPEGVSDLLYTIKSLGFFKIEASHVSIVPCCDRFSYELTVVTDELANSAATYDGAPSTPSALSSAIQAVTNFLDRVKGSS